MTIQSLKEKGALWAIIGVSTFAGAAGGAPLFNAIAAHAQATSPAPVVQTTPAASPADTDVETNDDKTMGAFHPNEDPAHESGESAAREAQENAGQRPTAP